MRWYGPKHKEPVLDLVADYVLSSLETALEGADVQGLDHRIPELVHVHFETHGSVLLSAELTKPVGAAGAVGVLALAFYLHVHVHRLERFWREEVEDRSGIVHRRVLEAEDLLVGLLEKLQQVYDQSRKLLVRKLLYSGLLLRCE